MMRLLSFCLLIFSLLGSIPALSEVTFNQTEEKRNSAWGLGFAGYQHGLKSGDGNNLLGTATAVQLGYIYIGDTWLINASVDTISGPYLSPQQQNTKLDYSGTGTTISFAMSAEEADIRTYQGNYGFALGLTYADIVGRVVGQRFDEEQETDKLVMRVTNFAIQPSVFFTWFEPRARKVSNRPVDLKTRLEGYYLNIGFLVPLITKYQLRWVQLERLEPDSDSTTDPLPGEITTIGYPQKRKGSLSGFSIIISFWAFLGV